MQVSWTLTKEPLGLCQWKKKKRERDEEEGEDAEDTM